MSARRPQLVVPLLAAAAAVLVITRQPVSDSDLFWHLAVGRDLAQGNAGVEHYAWTIAGRPMLLDQWIGELLFYASYAARGWVGVIALRAIAVAVITGVVVATTASAAPRRPLLALLAAFPALVVSRYAWSDRPELFGLAFFAILVALLRGDDRRVLALPPLLLVWSNTHGSYLLGLALVLVVLAERALRVPRLRRRETTLAVVSLVVTLPTIVQERLASTSQFWAPPRDVAEWGVPDPTVMPGLAFALIVAAVFVAALLSPAREPAALLVLVPTAFVSLTASRFMPFFGLAAAPFLARAAAGWWDARRSGPPGREVVLGARAHATATAALALAVGAGLATAPRDADLSGYPVTALAALPAGPGVLAQYDWGGFLIWYAPATPVFIDGRLVPYAGSVRADYGAIVSARPGWEGVTSRRGVRAMLVRPSDAIAIRAPERGWRVAYADEVAVILIR